MPGKPDVVRRIEQETGLTLTEGGTIGYELHKGGEIRSIFFIGAGLRKVPEAIVGLDCMVSMSFNQITEVPANLGNNGGRHDIHLDNNLIESLPPECVDWETIPALLMSSGYDSYVYLDDNPLKNPPPSVLEKGIEALRSWFTAQRELPQRASAETAESYSVGNSSSPQPRRAKIFLCYRREDTQGFARSIYDRLAEKYGQEQVFRDIDSTPLGVKFSTWIQSRVDQCDVMIVLIGNSWSSAKDQAGQRRLDLPKDWVRQEIEAALTQEIPIIPVRVQGALMPSEDELPPSIADLTGFQSAEVTDSRWAFDMGLLIQAIDNLVVSD